MADRREEIVAAALRVFAREGFHKASIKQIAAEARLNSPSLIYWYFKDKNELLSAVQQHVLPLIERTADPVPLMELSPEQFFRVVAQSFFSAFERPEAGQLMRVLFSEALRSPETVQGFSANILPVIETITSYLRQQMERGRLSVHDPGGIARAFVSTLLIYQLGTQIFTLLGEGFPEQATYVDDVIAVFLKGLTP